MALAIHFDRLLREGLVRDQSELARLAHVTQPRMTQIMNLNHLAPSIQEAVLFLPAQPNGREGLRERHLRRLVTFRSWEAQIATWRKLNPGTGPQRASRNTQAESECRDLQTDAPPAQR
jgi:hypothetical protein